MQVSQPILFQQGKCDGHWSRGGIGIPSNFAARPCETKRQFKPNRHAREFLGNHPILIFVGTRRMGHPEGTLPLGFLHARDHEFAVVSGAKRTSALDGLSRVLACGSRRIHGATWVPATSELTCSSTPKRHVVVAEAKESPSQLRKLVPGMAELGKEGSGDELGD